MIALFTLTHSPMLSPAFHNGDGKRGSGFTTNKPWPSGRGVEGLTYTSAGEAQAAFVGNGQQINNFVGRSVVLADFNGDGFIDAVSSGRRNADADPCPNRVLLNDEKGRFTETGQIFDEGLRHSHGLALGDFDRDGDPVP